MRSAAHEKQHYPHERVHYAICESPACFGVFVPVVLQWRASRARVTGLTFGTEWLEACEQTFSVT